MVGVRDVPADRLINALAEEVKGMPGFEPPLWSRYAKTGSQAERPPQRADWWYARAASLLRKVYLNGPLGTGTLEREYGATKAVAYFPKHHRDAGGSAIRQVMKQLEQAELVAKTPKGRVMTSKGTALLDKVSKQIFDGMVEGNKALARYG